VDAITGSEGWDWSRRKGLNWNEGNQEGLREEDGMRSVDLLTDTSPFLAPLLQRLGKIPCTAFGIRSPYVRPAPTMTGGPNANLIDSSGQPIRATLE
jgi:hypothetical protein